MPTALSGPPMIAGLLIILGCLIAGFGTPVVLRRLPEPAPPPGASAAVRAEYDNKPSYRSLVTGRFIVGCTASTAVALIIAVLTQPGWLWGCWLVFGTVAVLLAAIDAAITWLPSPLIFAGWSAMALGTAFAVILAPDHRWRLLATIAGCAAIAGVGYFGLWLVTRGQSVAFGDVRLMPLVGAVAGTMGWAGLYWTVLAGSLIGAVIGVARLAAHRRGPFPYAPALVAGPYVAALWQSLW